MDGACQEQSFVFNRSRYPSATLEPILFKINGVVMGASLMMIQRLPLGLGAVAVTKWGPAIRDDSDRTAYGVMIDALTKEYADRRGMLLSVMPRVRPEVDNPDYATLVEKGFRRGDQRRNPDRYLVDLRLPDDAMRKGFEQKWRNRLNKAEKSNLTFERAGIDGLPAFTELFNEMKGRKGIIDRTAFATVPDLLNHANPALRAELFLVHGNGKPLAGAIVFKAGDMPFYIYGATGADALPISAGHFINFNVMRWLRDNTKARWYNLGGTDGNAGLETFKLGLIGKTGLVRPFPPMATYAPNWRASVFGRGAWAARDHLQALRRRLGK
jgi:lipid II:glycine glycyltransferase (peptidoglycan interpeptide bridge formation enzyme)